MVDRAFGDTKKIGKFLGVEEDTNGVSVVG
jgi:hypothetical protein